MPSSPPPPHPSLKPPFKVQQPRVTQFHRSRLKCGSSAIVSTNSSNSSGVKVFGLVLILYIILCIFVRVVSSGTDWCYDNVNCGPTHWGGLCKSGNRQSPINIPTAKVTSRTATNTRIILNKNYALPKLFFLKNTGHSLQLSINGDDKSKCFLLGDGLGKKPYYFSQLHFHWGPNNLMGSEHRISGKTYPLEMHMVHRQIKDPNKIAVLSILFYISPNDNPNLETILSLTGKVKQPSSVIKTTAKNKITLTKFFPKKMRMFRYAGSLTTPPCSESVVWTVFRDPIPVSSKQMGKFRKLLSLSHKPLMTNFRPVQPTFTSVRKNIFFVRQLKKNDDDDDDDDDNNAYVDNPLDDEVVGGHFYGGGGDHGYKNGNPSGSVFWGSAGYGYGDHYHPTKADWDYWHPDQIRTYYQSGPNMDDFELDNLNQSGQWVDLASIV